MSTIGSDTPSTLRDVAILDEKLTAVGTRSRQEPKRILEEDEYLGRLASIIKRDFFPGSEALSDSVPQTPEPSLGSQRTEKTIFDSPMTERTSYSGASSARSRRHACSMRLNDYLGKYTSEDNAYFDKLQARQLRRHRHRFPWLYKDEANSKDRSGKSDQLALGASSSKSLSGGDREASKMIEWHNNGRLYPPTDGLSPQSTVNYDAIKYLKRPIFKEPMPVSVTEDRPRGLNRFTDKIGVDGKPLNGSEASPLDQFNFSTMPETPRVDSDAPRTKQETSRFFMPSESPRDILANRLYEQKIATKIRTPRSSTRSNRTPKTDLNKIFS